MKKGHHGVGELYNQVAVRQNHPRDDDLLKNEGRVTSGEGEGGGAWIGLEDAARFVDMLASSVA